MTEKPIVADKGAWLSIITYIVLTCLKISIGYLTQSEALVADGMNNSTDIIASIAVLIGLKISRKPRDSDHPYGHWRAENISSLIASFIMATIGLQVLFGAVRSLSTAEGTVPGLLAAWTGLLSACVMGIVYLYNKRLAERTNSQALKAVAKDNLSDALVSVGAVVGIIGAQFQLPWLDPAAAVAVGLFICKTAWDIFSDATHTLTDGFNRRKLKEYERMISDVPGVDRVVDLKGRVQGNQTILDVVIEVNPDYDVQESHNITEMIEGKLKDSEGIETVHIHVEPSDGERTT